MLKYIFLVSFCGITLHVFAGISDSLFERDAVLSRSNVSALFVNLNTGDTLEDYRSKNVNLPASLLKLFTTATALEIYGPAHRIPTYVEYNGKISDGVLYGDIYVRGTGDPTLGSAVLAKRNPNAFLTHWVQRLKALGINEIRGSVIADASFYDTEATNPAWLWEDIGNYYGMGVMPLAFMDNTVNIILKSGPVDSIATVLKTYPEYPDLEFVNYIRCQPIQYDGAFVHGMPYDNKRYLYGSVPSKLNTFGIKGDMPNPPLFLAQCFTTELRKNGVSVANEAKYITEPSKNKREQLFTHFSPTLDTIINIINQESNNLYAEMLFRNFASQYRTPCSIHNSIMLVESHWRNKVDMRNVVIKDGCGLAPQNSVSPQAFVQLLTYMSKTANAEAFFQSLPVSGETGTLKGIFMQPALRGRIHAKSGSIANVKNYAGYFDVPNGDRWVFVIMISGARAKQKILRAKIENYILNVYKRHYKETISDGDNIL